MAKRIEVKRVGRKEYLRELKLIGVFPWSNLATRSFVSVVVFACVLGSIERIKSAIRLDLTGFLSENANSRSEALDVAHALVTFLLLSSFLALVAGFIGTVIQTRGAFGRAAQRTAKGRLTSSRAHVILLTMVSAVLAGLAAFYRFSPMVLDGIKIEGGAIIGPYIGYILRDVCKLVVVVSGVLAVLLVFVTRLVFVFGVAPRKLKELPDIE